MTCLSAISLFKIKGMDVVFFFEMADLEIERQMISEMKDALSDMTSRKSSSSIR